MGATMTAKKSDTAKRAEESGAKTPDDRKATAPGERKAKAVQVLADEVVLEWDEDTYTIERDAIDDVEFVLELEQGKELSAIIRLLGRAQWDTFKAGHRRGTRVPMSEARDFLGALLKELQKVQNSGN